MNKPYTVVLSILLLLIMACDKKESSIEKPATDISINFSGAINENWENEDGWFVINQLYKLKDRNQLSITLSKGYTNLSIIYQAEEENLQAGTYSLLDKVSEVGFAQAEYYVLGSKDIYKSLSGKLTLYEISKNKVQGVVQGTFKLPGTDEKLSINGTFTVPPLY